MKKLGYKKSKLTLNNLINNVVICPDDLFDLEVLFKAIKNISGELLLSINQLKEIYKSSQRIKIAHRIAGRTFSKKIALSLSKQNIEENQNLKSRENNKISKKIHKNYITSNNTAILMMIKPFAKILN